MKFIPILLAAFYACCAFGQQVATVDTMSNLLARPVPTTVRPGYPPIVVDVFGNETIGDWSVKRWRYDPTNAMATNAIRRHTSAGVGRWVYDWKDGNVDVFGARGDDTADDTIAISNAVVEAKLQNIQLYVPRGTYKLTSTIDLRNSGDNALEFPGITGDGITLTKFKAYHTNDVFLVQGRGGVFEKFRIEYDTIRDRTMTAANAVHAYGFSYYMSFRDIEIVNAYKGLYVDALANGLFSCTFDNFVVRTCGYANVDVQTGSGNNWANVYLSNPGTDAVEFLFQDRAGASTYGQFNLEHSNFRDCAIRLRGDGAIFGHFHLEGLRPVTDANFVDVAGEPGVFGLISLENSYSAGHYISSFTSNGVATINALGQAVPGGHGFRVGDTLSTLGATPSDYVGSFPITAITPTNLTVTLGSSPGVDASVNYAGGNDFIWAYIGSYPDAALFATETYGNSTIDVGALTMRNNKILSYNSAGRTGWAIKLAREFGGRKMKVSVNNITQGSQYRIGDNAIGFNPVVASSRSANVTTFYTKYPHNLQQGDRVSLSGGLNLNFGVGANKIAVASVINRHSATVSLTGADSSLIADSGNMLPVKAAVLTYSRTNNIAELTTDVAHQLAVGSRIVVRSMAVSAFSDLETVVIATSSATNLSYANVGADTATTSESNGIIFEFSSGLNTSLQSSGSTALVKAGEFLRPLICLPYAELASGASTSVVYTVNGARPVSQVAIQPLADLVIGASVNGWVAANDQVTLKVYNPTSSTITNQPTLAGLEIIAR